MGGLPARASAQKLRLWSAPVVALTASASALGCLVTVTDLALQWPQLRLLSPDVAGWAALAVVVAAGVAALCVAGAGTVGAAPPLALGAVSGVLGATLSRDLASNAQLVLGLLTLAVAVGALVAAGVCMVEELPGRWSGAALVAWVVPLAGGWGVLGWLTLRGRSADRVTVSLPAPLWTVTIAAAVLGLWGLLTEILGPAWPRHRDAQALRWAGWEGCWALLATLVVGVGSIAMLVGFQPDHAAAWVRPIVLLATATGVVGLAVCGWLVPEASSRAAYVAVVVALLGGPACLELLLLVSSQGSGGLSVWVAAILAVAGAAGCWVGWSRPGPGAPWCLLLMALGAAVGWVMPSSPAAMLAGAGPLALGMAGACSAGLRMSGETSMGLRLVSTAGLVALLFGLAVAFPLTWALGAELTDQAAQIRAGGRILLGMTFALAVLAAAAAVVLRPVTRSHDTGADAEPAYPSASPAGRRP